SAGVAAARGVLTLWALSGRPRARVADRTPGKRRRNHLAPVLDEFESARFANPRELALRPRRPAGCPQSRPWSRRQLAANASEPGDTRLARAADAGAAPKVRH